MAEDSFEPVLNWPRSVVDEITMVHLRRLADENGVRLAELLRSADELGGRVSPLTRRAMRELVEAVDGDLGRLAGWPMAEALEPFLAALAARRSPIPFAEREALRDTYDLLGSPLRPLVAALREALDAGRPVVLSAANGPDEAAAATLIRHCLRTYLGVEPGMPGDPAERRGAFIIEIGHSLGVGVDRIELGPLPTRTVRFTTTTCAWWSVQMLLMSYEILDQGEFVLFDIETSNNHPERAEIIEYAALPFWKGGVAGAGIANLVRPSGPHAIDAGATDIQGLRWQDVADASVPSACLPRLFDALRGKVVVGHNLETFDLPVLRRAAERAGWVMTPPYALDTRRMAERLWPGEASYRLEDLALRSDPNALQRHRATDDCLLVGQIFKDLCLASRRERELGVLSECMPLVAVSIVASADVAVYDNALLAGLGARASALGIGGELLGEWEGRAGAPLSSSARDALRGWPLGTGDDDARWQRLIEGWRGAVETFASVEPHGGIDRFLRHVALAQPVDSLPRHRLSGRGTPPESLSRDERVHLMTVHSAKGLEWDVVFLAGVEDDQYPHYRTAGPDQLAEERRVLYVGMTRARDRLFFFSTERRQGRAKRRSRFLDPLVGATIDEKRAGGGAVSVTPTVRGERTA